MQIGLYYLCSTRYICKYVLTNIPQEKQRRQRDRVLPARSQRATSADAQAGHNFRRAPRSSCVDLRSRLARSACGGVGLLAVVVPYPRRVGCPSGDGVSHADADFFSYERGLTTPTTALQIPRNPTTQAGSSHYCAPQTTLGRVGTRLIS